MQLWDVSLELCSLHSFDALAESMWAQQGGQGDANRIELSHLIFLPAISASSSEKSGGEKWAGWCTTDIEARPIEIVTWGV